MPDALLRLITSMEPAPAYVLGPRWEFLAWNRPKAQLYPTIDRLDGADRNLVWVVFAEPSTRTLIADWAEQARRIMAEFRAGTAGLRGDPVLDELVDGCSRRARSSPSGGRSTTSPSSRRGLRRYQHPRARRRWCSSTSSSRRANGRRSGSSASCPLPGDDSARRLSAWHDVA